VPTADTVLEEGDEILAVLDPGKEEDLKTLFGPASNGGNGSGSA
jgi:Trk K+ transport system NAD-binding subunit